MALASELSAAPAAKPEASAERAVYKASVAGRAALCGSNDLVEACHAKRVDLASLPAEQLNEEMKAMSPEQRRAFIDQKIKDRETCQARISELNTKRQGFIQQKLAEAGGAKDSFDALVLDSLKRQGAKCGLTYLDDKK